MRLQEPAAFFFGGGDRALNVIGTISPLAGCTESLRAQHAMVVLSALSAPSSIGRCTECTECIEIWKMNRN